MVATDRKGTVIYYNDGAKTSLGYSEAEVLGAPVGKLYPSLEEAKRVKAAMRSPEYGGKGIVETFRTTFLSKAGEEIPVAISGAILIDEHGEEDGTVGFAKDLREILHREELATLGEVAIGLSHEINNPLAVMLNQAELLERDICELAGERDVSVEMERLDAVRREISRVAEIVERLGEMVREETYETVDYIGPARMLDLRARRSRERKPDPRLAGAADPDRRRRPRHRPLAEGDPRGGRLPRGHRPRRARGAREADDAAHRPAAQRRGDAEHGRAPAVPEGPGKPARPAGADDDGVPLRQRPHHQAQPRGGARHA